MNYETAKQFSDSHTQSSRKQLIAFHKLTLLLSMPQWLSLWFSSLVYFSLPNKLVLRPNHRKITLAILHKKKVIIMSNLISIDHIQLKIR